MTFTVTEYGKNPFLPYSKSDFLFCFFSLKHKLTTPPQKKKTSETTYIINSYTFKVVNLVQKKRMKEFYMCRLPFATSLILKFQATPLIYLLVF